MSEKIITTKKTSTKYTPAQAVIMFSLSRGLSDFIQKKYKEEIHTKNEWEKRIKKIT